jgi:hypothetical protein
MQEAMADSDLTIAALSEHYLKAEFTQPEWAAAFARVPQAKIGSSSPSAWPFPFFLSSFLCFRCEGSG